jgi:eukaryotic-like serine/threonine-protein kinase
MDHVVMQSGQTIAGKYRLNQPIGAGGMASVWSATNVFTERHFAIKFMHAAVAKTPEAAHRFLMEAKVSARVNHPNIIEIIDVGQAEDGSLFMVMELLQGVSLETAIRRQSPPMLLHEFIGVMIDVARALTAAHKNGVVHRDLKPTNIYLHMIREGVAVPKLLDFGVSKFTDTNDNALTVAGTVLGSPMYMSPEQAMGSDSLDGRTDVFAFGAILFEAMCGIRPYDGPNFNALIVTIATKQPKSVDEFAPQMPEGLRALVRDCLVTDRKKRLSSFEEIVDRLLDLLPELEQSGLRLPGPAGKDAASDPDATNALPLVRESGGAGPSAPTGVHLSEPPPGASPPAAFTSPYQADWTADRAAVTMMRAPPMILFAGLGALIALIAVGITLIVARGIAAPIAPTAAALPIPVPERVPAAIPSAPPPVVTSYEMTEPPVVGIDSLPMASRGQGPGQVPGAAAVAPLAKGVGRVVLTASPGWCVVKIDGQTRGPTPLPPLNLPVGLHHVTCTTPAGKVHTITVSSVEGIVNPYKFTLDPPP